MRHFFHTYSNLINLNSSYSEFQYMVRGTFFLHNDYIWT